MRRHKGKKKNKNQQTNLFMYVQQFSICGHKVSILVR